MVSQLLGIFNLETQTETVKVTKDKNMKGQLFHTHTETLSIRRQSEVEAASLWIPSQNAPLRASRQ